MNEHDFKMRADAAILKVLNSSWAAVIFEFDKLWGEVKEEFIGEPEQLKEFERRIYELKIRFLPEATPKQAFDATWYEMLKLGFSNLNLKGTAAFYRADYLCNLAGEVDAELLSAIEIIEDVVLEFERGADTEMSAHYKNVLERLRKKRNRISN